MADRYKRALWALAGCVGVPAVIYGSFWLNVWMIRFALEPYVAP